MAENTRMFRRATDSVLWIWDSVRRSNSCCGFHSVFCEKYNDVHVYSETCLQDHLRNRDNLGIKDSYFSP